MLVYPILVREFYANLRFRINPITRRKDKSTLISRVSGIDIELNVQNVGTIFQIPTSDGQLNITDSNSVTLFDTEFDFQTALTAMSEVPQTVGEAKVVNLSLPCHLIHRILHINLNQKSGSKEAIHSLDIYLTWAVWTGRPLNWSNFIFYLLASGGKRKDSNLIFGRALSKIFEAYAIDLTTTESLELTRFDYFNETLLNLMRYKLVNGQWVRRTALAAPDPTQVAGSSSAPPVPPPSSTTDPGGPPHAPRDVSLNDLMNIMQDIYQEVRWMRPRVARMEHHLRRSDPEYEYYDTEIDDYHPSDPEY